MNHLLIGAGAGLVSALLIAVVAKATVLALFLFLLAPVPILVVSLGWNHRAGLVGTVVGAIATALAGGDPLDGVAFAIGTALPAWWLAYLALLGRPDASGTIEWYPLGRLLCWIAATAALTYLSAAFVAAGSYEGYQQLSRESAELFLRMQTNTPPQQALPDIGGVPAATLVARFADAAPVFAAQGFTLILVFYVWVSAKIVSISGRLPRPWPSLAATAMPRAALAILGGAVLVASFAGGFVGVFASALAGALAFAFCLQALAAVHDLSAGRPARFAILFATYVLLLMSQGLILIGLCLFGIADTALGLRERFRRPKPASGRGPFT